MLLFFEKIFDQEKCNQLNILAMRERQKDNMRWEGNDFHYGNSYGIGGLPYYEELLDTLTPFVKEATGYKTIQKENSFTRIYYNGGDLKRHVDRPGLDLTLSVCTFSNLSQPWPIYVEDMDRKIHKIVTNIGDGALILGTKMTHWRDKLVCPEDNYVIQSFFHWRILDDN